MAKRKAPSGRKTSGGKKTTRRAAGARKRTSGRATKASRTRAQKSARKAAARRSTKRTAPRRAAKKAVKRTRPAASARKATAPKPAATQRAAAPPPRPAPPRRPAPQSPPPAVAAPVTTPETTGTVETRDETTGAGDDTDEEEEEPLVPGAPSSLMPDRRAGRARAVDVPEDEFAEEVSADGGLRAGDVDVDPYEAASVGDEAPGGDNPTPDQDVVDLIGRSLGVEYEDEEELKGADKIAARDRRRWELDPASSEDYRDRAKKR